MIETAAYDHVAVVPVGLGAVGSAVFEYPFKYLPPHSAVPVDKGDVLGHFAYGGSLVITLIEQGIDAITIPQGQQIGRFKSKMFPQ
ncbi:phosphatidylserine decarboxylase [Methylocaldum sp. MU1018]